VTPAGYVLYHSAINDRPPFRAQVAGVLQKQKGSEALYGPEQGSPSSRVREQGISQHFGASISVIDRVARPNFDTRRDRIGIKNKRLQDGALVLTIVSA
jgi:hypothetical protein